MCIIRKTIEERKESMATGKALDGKPYAGNPHVRFDEGEVALAATPRRGSLLYKDRFMKISVRGTDPIGGTSGGVAAGKLDDPGSQDGDYGCKHQG